MCENCKFRIYCYDRDELRCYMQWRAVDRDRFYAVYKLEGEDFVLHRNIIKPGFRLFYITTTEKQIPLNTYYCIEANFQAARKRFKKECKELTIASIGVCRIDFAMQVLKNPADYRTL